MPIVEDELTLLWGNLSAKLTTLETLNAEILEVTPEDQLDGEIEKVDEYYERIQRSLLRIRRAFKLTTRTPPPLSTTTPRDSTTPLRDPTTPPRDPTTPPRDLIMREPTVGDTPSRLDPGVTVTSGVVSSGKVKLPKISLPHFKGNPIYWTSFWDSYQSAIHLNSSLSDVDKFNYLWLLLERSAYESIAGLTLSSVNYHEAINILKKRFGNQ